MRDFKSFVAALATLDEIETAQMIRKIQFSIGGRSLYEQFAMLDG